jgi:hypothetical protein
VLLKDGVVRRHSLELLLNKIESVRADQGLLGGLLGYGTITIAGTGGTRGRFGGLGNVQEFRQVILEEMQSVTPEGRVLAERATVKTCPDCAELVKLEARLCRFCGYRFEAPSPALNPPSSRSQSIGLPPWSRYQRSPGQTQGSSGQGRLSPPTGPRE